MSTNNQISVQIPKDVLNDFTQKTSGMQIYACPLP